MTGPRLRLVVLASGNGSNLRAIAQAIDAGLCHASITAVVSDRPDAKALTFAEARGVPVYRVPFSKGDDRAAWNDRLESAVADLTPDVVVLAGFMRILGPNFIARFRQRIVNVHPALLPSFKGHDGPAQAIAAGVRISGCTVHLVDEGVDTGEILAQGAVPVLPDDTVASLHARIQRVEHALLPRVLDAIARSEITLDPVTVHTAIGTEATLLVPPGAPLAP